MMLRVTCVLIGINMSLMISALGLGLSRSTGTVAFVSLHSGNGEIYLMDVFATLTVNLTRHPSSDSAPDWSPDGRYLAFVSTRDGGQAHLFVFDMLTHTTRQLTEGDFDDVNPAWSTDGSKLAFASNRELNWRVYTIGLVGQAQPVQMMDNSPGRHPIRPTWSSRGQVTFSVIQDNLLYAIYVSDTDLQRAEQLTPGVMIETRLAWSPDGKFIGFSSVTNFNQEVYTLDVESKQLTNLSNHGFYDGPPVWSPDGQSLAFASGRSGDIQIYLMQIGDTTPHQLTTGPRASEPLWSPDGRWLIARSGQNQNGALALVDAITGERRWLADAQDDYYSLAWRP